MWRRFWDADLGAPRETPMRASNGLGDIMEGLGVWMQIGGVQPACWEETVGFVGTAPTSEWGHLDHYLQM